MVQFNNIAVGLIYFLTAWNTYYVNEDKVIVVARKGTRTILPCFDQKQFDDVVSLSWKKTSYPTNIELFNNNEELPRPDKYSVSISYQLEILNVNASDAGSYVCKYRKYASVTFRTVELYVPELYIKECSNVEESTCHVNGSSDVLTCKFSGFPAAIIVSWLRIPGNGAVLNEYRLSSSEEFGDGAVLDEQRFSSNEELDAEVVLEEQRFSSSEEFDDEAVLEEQRFSSSEEFDDEAVVDEERFSSSEEFGDGAVVEGQRFSSSEELDDEAVLEEQSFSSSEELNDETVLKEQRFSSPEEFDDEVVLDEERFSSSEEFVDGAVLEEQRFSSSEELDDGAVLDKQRFSSSGELRDGLVLDEQTFTSSGELVITSDRERENILFVCRVIDGSGTSTYAAFERTVSGNVNGNTSHAFVVKSDYFHQISTIFSPGTGIIR